MRQGAFPMYSQGKHIRRFYSQIPQAQGPRTRPAEQRSKAYSRPTYEWMPVAPDGNGSCDSVI